MERGELLDILWTQAEPILFITREEFDAAKMGWDIRGFEIDGQLAIITVQKGPEFHFTTLGTGKKIPLRMMKEFLVPIIQEHGFAFTRTPHEDTRQQRFNRRFGFVQVGEDALDIHYRLERLPHA
jgi:hypothetical protein